MTNKLCLRGLGVVALVLCAVDARADQMPPSMTESTTTSTSTYTAPAPVFRTTARLRNEGAGLNVGVYGGISPFQNGDVDITSPALPGTSLEETTKDRIGGVAGFKVGYTWASFGAMTGQTYATDETPSWIMPSIDYDFFWTGLDYKASGADSSFKADLDLATFALEPTLKFRLGRFHPYVGFGLGGTYVHAGNASLSVPGGTEGLGSSDTFDFSAEGIAGTEFFISQHWALTAEYKYLYIDDPKLNGQGTTPINYHSDGLGLQLFTAGIKFYF